MRPRKIVCDPSLRRFDRVVGCDGLSYDIMTPCKKSLHEWREIDVVHFFVERLNLENEPTSIRSADKLFQMLITLWGNNWPDPITIKVLENLVWVSSRARIVRTRRRRIGNPEVSHHRVVALPAPVFIRPAAGRATAYWIFHGFGSFSDRRDENLRQQCATIIRHCF